MKNKISQLMRKIQAEGSFSKVSKSTVILGHHCSSNPFLRKVINYFFKLCLIAFIHVGIFSDSVKTDLVVASKAVFMNMGA